MYTLILSRIILGYNKLFILKKIFVNIINENSKKDVEYRYSGHFSLISG